jgi:phosphatidylserine/phosphatidylglycerophosphate/cardiolipin synthase-like enzyme
VVCIALSACAVNPYLSQESKESGLLSHATVLRHASAGPLEVTRARIVTDNGEAFLSKLSMVRRAKSTVDASYYIFAADVTSSALAAELIAAARRGVRVRLLLDYSSTYANLDSERADESGDDRCGHIATFGRF